MEKSEIQNLEFMCGLNTCRIITKLNNLAVSWQSFGSWKLKNVNFKCTCFVTFL